MKTKIAPIVLVPVLVLVVAMYVAVLMIILGRADLVGAQAAPPCSTHGGYYPASGIFGRCEKRGYFTNSAYTAGSGATYAFTDGSSGDNRQGMNVNNVDEFITAIRQRSQSTNFQDRTSASYIVHSMLGIQAPATPENMTQRIPTASELADWEDRVRQANALGAVDWDARWTFSANHFNTWWDPVTQDNHMYIDGDGQTRWTIVFYDLETGRPQYMIKKNCGNPIGSLNPLNKYDGWANATCDTIWGEAYDLTRRYTQDINVRIYVWLEGQPMPSAFSLVQSNNDGNPASPAGFSYTVPSSVKSNTVRTFASVRMLDTSRGWEIKTLFEGAVFNGPCIPENVQGQVTSADCSYVRGWAADLNNGNKTITVRIYAALWGDPVTAHDIPATTTWPDSPIGDHGFQWAVPAHFKSSSRTTYIVVRMLHPDTGAEIPGDLYHAIVNNNQPCNPTNWTYSPAKPTSPTIDDATNPKPGRAIQISGVVTNVGDGGGPGFNHFLRMTYETSSGWSPITEIHATRGGLAPGQPSTATHTFTLGTDAKHNGLVCFRHAVDPWQGQSTPTMTTTSTDWRWADEDLCMTIFNQRFAINELDISPDGGSSQVFPGAQDVPFSFSFENSGDFKVGYPGAEHGFAPNITAEVVVSSGNVTIDPFTYTPQNVAVNAISDTGSFTVDLGDGVPGDFICLTLRVTPQRGFSDPADRVGAGIADERFCFDFGEQPYLEVYGSDVWAGANWAGVPDYKGGAWCPFVTSQEDTFIKSVRRGGIGSFAEYGATAMAVEGIIDFVTRTLETGPYNESLMFANTGSDTPGSYHNQAKCVTDYYNYLSKDPADGVQIVTSSTNLPSGEGQFYRDGDLLISLPQTIGNRQMVLLVNGDVNISNDITYGDYTVSDARDIPFFMVVATGNINISKNVSELDGIYISRDSQINTCYDGGDGSGRLRLDSCPEQLVVRGSFMARDIQFRRTYSGVIRNEDQDPNKGSELFQFSPELLLARPVFITDYVQKLPASQVKDLPPIY